VSGKKYKRASIVAGKQGKSIIAPLQYSGTMDSVLFEDWFSNILLKSVKRGSVIIMDNASFHRKTKLPQMAEGCGCRVVFLPPYSPELNPIEKFWNWLKRHLRKILPDYNNFDDALSACFNVR
jgi:transposase